jgi:7-cyano-7-deazaguanine synthase
MTKQKAVAIVSGGLDSVTLAHHLADLDFDLHLLSIDYGQRHLKEIHFALLCAERLGAKHDVVDLSSITALIGSSSLTGNLEVPDGHYAEQTMKATVVPNRNMMMLSIAVSVAISEGAQFAVTGVHGGDHFIYPDCRPEFISAASAAALIGNVGFGEDFRGILAPFVYKDKAWIAGEAARLGVPIEETWSCYKGGSIHCGRCGTCVERLEAIDIAGVEDPTQYEDREFWKEKVEEHG